MIKREIRKGTEKTKFWLNSESGVSIFESSGKRKRKSKVKTDHFARVLGFLSLLRHRRLRKRDPREGCRSQRPDRKPLVGRTYSRRVSLILPADLPLSSSFLPQDKVSSFATMSPQELLRQTQKAAGPAKMTEWHEQLIKLGKEWKEMDHASSGRRVEDRTRSLELDSPVR